jgi:hypothetical protein
MTRILLLGLDPETVDYSVRRPTKPSRGPGVGQAAGQARHLESVSRQSRKFRELISVIRGIGG